MGQIKQPARYMVTAALPYANGPLHIGHLAGAYLPADFYVRFLRLKVEEVVFVCGSDEHGVAITIRARKEGLTPKEVVDKYHEQIKTALAEFDVATDIYSRTSNTIHHETAQEFFLKFYQTGQLTEQTSEQFYDSEANMFLADRFITGTCPKCGYDKAYGDQCEKCGTSLNPTDLINPVSTITGKTPELRETKHWYIPLDKYQKQIEKYILEDHTDWKTNVFGQCKSWLNEGLQPRAITRDMDWGIPLPKEVTGGEGKVLYVWFDAPLGYISATKEYFVEKGNPEGWKPYWQAKDTKLVHFIGKDNIVFHCIIFPIMLMGHGDYILADEVPANEFLNLEGDKISTSRNWAVWAHEFVAEHPDKTDVMRYVLGSTLPETKDNDFTWKDFQTRNNSELVEIFGNFVNRVLTLIHKHFEGKIPNPDTFTETDQNALAQISLIADEISDHITNFRFRNALQSVMNLARVGNKYLAETEPWHLIKKQPERVPTVLYVGAQITTALSIAFAPFLPKKSAQLRAMLDIASDFSWQDLYKKEIIQTGRQLGKAELLFHKIEDSFVEAQIQKLEASKKANEAANASLAPAKGTITYEDFDKIDLRIGTILKAEKVKNADKLLKLEINTGLDVRTVVSGIAKFYQPEEIVGRQVLILVNLAPRKLKGIESQGMIMMAEDPTGKLIFVQPESEFPNGSIVK